MCFCCECDRGRLQKHQNTKWSCVLSDSLRSSLIKYTFFFISTENALSAEKSFCYGSAWLKMFYEICEQISSQNRTKNAICNYICLFCEHQILHPWGPNSGNPDTHSFVGNCSCVTPRKQTFQNFSHHVLKARGYHNYTTLNYTNCTQSMGLIKPDFLLFCVYAAQ